MAHYDIRFISLQETTGKLNAIQQVLGEHADNLFHMSRDVQQGLEIESKSLMSWSLTVRDYAENANRARMCLETVIQNYYDAERLVYERLLDADSTLDEGIMTEGSELLIEKEENRSSQTIDGLWRNKRKNKPAWVPDHYHKPDTERNSIQPDDSQAVMPPLEEIITRWGNVPTDKPPWNEFPEPVDWRTLTPLITSIIGSLGHTAQELWELIWSILSKKTDVINEVSTGAAIDGGSNAEDTNITLSLEIAVGAGEIDRPDEQFSGAESGVSAKMSRGSGGFSGNSATVDASDDGSRDWMLGSLTSVKPNVEENEGELILVQPPDDLELPADDEPIAASENMFGPEYKDVFGPEFDSSIISKATEKSSGGFAAPLIGVTSAASIAASGWGIRNQRMENKDAEDENAQPNVSAVSAKEAKGIFSGNLKGEYIILTLVFSLLFSGASIIAGTNIKKRKSKTDERFRIGYGESAVLHGGAIQERSL